MTGAPHLITTALEESWPAQGEAVFLGEWCRLYSRRAAWEGAGHPVLPSPWADPSRVPEAYAYVSRVYERLLSELAVALGTEHGIDLPLRSWRVLLGPWLLYYLPLMYDHHLAVAAAIEAYPDLTSMGPAEVDCVVPRDTLEFVLMGEGDQYNLQIYTRLLTAAGIGVTRGSYPVPRPAEDPGPGSGGARSVARKALMIAPDRVECVLKDSYLPRRFELDLAVRTGGRVRPVAPAAEASPAGPVDHAIRERLAPALSDGGDAFGAAVARLVALDLPQCYVETFDRMGELARDAYPMQPKAIVTANAWYFDERFKRWSAECAARGVRLVGAQHGGTYGSTARSGPCEHEMTLTDEFLSWGWTSADGRPASPMPAPKLIGRASVPADASKTGVLFVGTADPRYVYELPYNPQRFERYLDRQLRFADALSPAMRGLTRARLHREDYGWDIIARWSDAAPDIAIEGWSVPFADSLASCRLYVCDHLSTTFLEALAADRPTVLFWDPADTPLVPEAEAVYETLRRVGVLHATPEAAAETVDVAYRDVVGWWTEPERRRTVDAFRRHFALTATDARERWLEKLRSAAGIS